MRGSNREIYLEDECTGDVREAGESCRSISSVYLGTYISSIRFRIRISASVFVLVSPVKWSSYSRNRKGAATLFSRKYKPLGLGRVRRRTKTYQRFSFSFISDTIPVTVVSSTAASSPDSTFEPFNAPSYSGFLSFFDIAVRVT